MHILRQPKHFHAAEVAVQAAGSAGLSQPGPGLEADGGGGHFPPIKTPSPTGESSPAPAANTESQRRVTLPPISDSARLSLAKDVSSPPTPASAGNTNNANLLKTLGVFFVVFEFFDFFCLFYGLLLEYPARERRSFIEAKQEKKLRR